MAAKKRKRIKQKKRKARRAKKIAHKKRQLKAVKPKHAKSERNIKQAPVQAEHPQKISTSKTVAAKTPKID